MDNLCEGCGKVYDMNAFGAGWKYCTAMCRSTKGGTQPILQGKQGRPSRFKKVSEDEVELIKAALTRQGWGLSDFHAPSGWYKGEPEPFVVYARRGIDQLRRVGFGKGFHQRWSHVIVHWDPFTKLPMFNAVCNKILSPRGKREFSSHNPDEPGYKFKRKPCGDGRSCKPCRFTQEFKAYQVAFLQAEEKRKLKARETKRAKVEEARNTG